MKPEFAGNASAKLPASKDGTPEEESERDGDIETLLPSLTLPPQVELKKLPALEKQIHSQLLSIVN